MAQSDFVLFSVDNRVALITVNDPDRRNALTGEISAQLRAAVEQAEADPGVHAVVVTGAGKAFCAGADLSALGAAGSGAAASGLQQLYDGFMAVGSCTLPTIAAVNGAAVGAGLNLALAADVRIAGPGALFDPRFQKLGLHPRRRSDLDAAAGGRPASRPRGPAVRHALRRRIRCPARVGAQRCRRSGRRGIGARRRTRGRSA